MSDPVTNVEIEDVLSSIRRLVSDDVRVPKPKPEAVKQPDRLVLTPALRVGAEDPEQAESAQAPVLLTDLAVVVDDPETVQSVEDFLDNQGLDAPDEGATMAETGVARGLGRQDDSLADEVERDITALRQVLQEAAPKQDDVLTGLVEQEVERALSDSDLDIEAEGMSSEKDPDDMVLESLVADLAKGAEEPAEEFHFDQDAEPSFQGDSLAGKIAALEELVGQRHSAEQDQEHPASDTPVFQRSLDVTEWQDDPQSVDREEPDVLAASTPDVIQPEGEEAEPDPSGEMDAAQDPLMIDEDSLRRLVSDIVRQELQGALGERITRNVRKLVRREIHRVLMSQDLD